MNKTRDINGIDALKLASEISKLPDGYFTIVFFPYNSTKGLVSKKVRTIERCKTRTQLPDDCFRKDSENFFLFKDEDGRPKTCYRILIRFIGYSSDNYRLRNVKWTT